ncbi:MAG: hypothetical protein ACE5NN_02055 [Candidatus Bathyarchaeia archaeon]
MLSKDQAIGALILVVCIVIAVGYLIVLIAPGAIFPMPTIAVQIHPLQFWAVAVVVLIAFLAIMFIGAWIGWTMATTPPPKPIEELELEEEKTEEEAEAEEKAEETTEEKTEETGQAEEKKEKK